MSGEVGRGAGVLVPGLDCLGRRVVRSGWEQESRGRLSGFPEEEREVEGTDIFRGSAMRALDTDSLHNKYLIKSSAKLYS